jgi:hypothetical protein
MFSPLPLPYHPWCYCNCESKSACSWQLNQPVEYWNPWVRPQCLPTVLVGPVNKGQYLTRQYLTDPYWRDWTCGSIACVPNIKHNFQWYTIINVLAASLHAPLVNYSINIWHILFVCFTPHNSWITTRSIDDASQISDMRAVCQQQNIIQNWSISFQCLVQQLLTCMHKKPLRGR